MEDSSLVPDPIRTSVGSVAIARQVQTASSFAYSATYNAQFQVLRDRLCSSEAPVVRVSCRGPNIQVLSTSDATIVCSSEMEADPEGRYFIECENTCASDNDCQEIYLQIDGDSWDGPFGEISFQCQGEELYEVDGYASIPGDEEGGSGGNCPSLSRLFHFVRLGVLCPAMDGSGGGGGDSQFVYDDLFFECFILNFPVDGYAENVYTCAVGERCDKAFCQIAFDDLVVHATLPRFQDQCVTPPVPVTLAPTPTMIDSLLLDAVSITARFQAAWGILLDDDETCSSNTPTVRITCLNGSSIRFISSIYDSASCQPAGDNALDCTDSTTDNIENEFTGVVYECFGPVSSGTAIEYPESTAFCNGNTEPSSISHAVQLGVYCYYIPDDAEEEEANFIATFLSNDDNGVANNNTLDNTQEVIVFRDIFMECVFQNHDYEHLSESGSTIKANRYTCIENMTFPTGSLAMETQTIPKVAIQADETLVTLEWEFCRSQVRVNNTFTVAPFPPVTIPAIPPTLGLVPVGLPSPSAVSPTLAPNQLPSLFSQVPLGGPAVNVIRDPPTDDGGDKILIAAVVSGVTLVGLIFGIAIFFIFFRNGKGKKIQTVDPFGNESDSGFPVVTTNESLAGSTPANNMAPGEDETPIRAIHETSEQRPRSARAIQFKDQVQDYDPSSGNSSPSHIPTVAFREDTVFTNSTTAVSRRVLDP